MKTIDARGLSCPEPVVLLRTAMASGEDSYQIIVDNHASREKKRRAAAFDCVDSAGVSRGLRFLTARFIRDVSSRNQTDADQDDEVGSQGKDPPCFRGFEEIK